MHDSIIKSVLFSKPVIAIEVAVLIIFGFQVGKEILERRAIEAEIAHLESEIQKLEYKKDDLGALIDYVQTDAFVEQEAREKLNLAKTGEAVVVIPDVDASAVDSSILLNGDESVNSKSGTVLGDTNTKLWWKYFFDQEQLWIDN
jgi:cell division protein FtsB